ncbi:MAG: gamma-glutamyl-gamma-aminobutyrate hydrolase family protein [Rickettsiaceae bacterium H1]|nr:gamma-glutamyl-gamma-aminobutyrate hydrolase family protein [Rickettsiaceae bacterium H1]
MTILLIDNYDSFSYNLYASIKKLGLNVFVAKNDKLTLIQVKIINPIAIIISPGPLAPIYSGICCSVIGEYGTSVPILGICLGHQIIAYLFGGNVFKGKKPMHGKVSSIVRQDSNNILFNGLPDKFKCMRYNSLVVDIVNSQELVSIAQDEFGVNMGIRHKLYDIYGLQFHPESILSEYGDAIIKNFVDWCYKKVNC